MTIFFFAKCANAAHIILVGLDIVPRVPKDWMYSRPILFKDFALNLLGQYFFYKKLWLFL